MSTVLETIEDSMVAMLQDRVTASGLLGASRVVAISEEGEAVKEAQNTPVILIRYAGGRPSSETESQYGVVAIGFGNSRVKTLRTHAWVALVFTKRLRTKAGRQGDTGTYSLLEEIDAAWQGKKPAGADRVLMYASAGDSVLEVPGVPDTVLIHGVTYETQAYYTSELEVGTRVSDDGERAGWATGRAGGA